VLCASEQPAIITIKLYLSWWGQWPRQFLVVGAVAPIRRNQVTPMLILFLIT